MDHKKSQKIKELESLRDFKQTIIFYESPHRINETIEVLYEVYKDRDIVIAREISKKYEEYIRGNIKDIINMDLALKGEIVLIVSGAKNSLLEEELNSKTILEHFVFYQQQGYKDMDAMKLVAKDRKISKSDVYKEVKGE